MAPLPRILIVEDNADDLVLLKRAMRQSNVQAEYDVATDGDSAVDELRRAADNAAIPRVVLLDLKLPRRSGFEVLEWIKSHPDLRALPVVILTSSDTSRDLARAYELGANSYLVKPLTPAALASMAQLIDQYWLRLNAQP